MYRAELHKNESVLTASQSNTLERAGVLDRSGSKPKINTASAKGGNTTLPPIEINIYGGDAQNIGYEVEKALDRYFRQIMPDLA